jgi:hypothetical protein
LDDTIVALLKSLGGWRPPGKLSAQKTKHGKAPSLIHLRKGLFDSYQNPYIFSSTSSCSSNFTKVTAVHYTEKNLKIQFRFDRQNVGLTQSEDDLCQIGKGRSISSAVAVPV